MSSIGSDVTTSSATGATPLVRTAVARPSGSTAAPASTTTTDTANAPSNDKSPKTEAKPTKSPDELAQQMNVMLERRDSQIRFEIDRTSHPSKVITQIVDKETHEVLRQFPSEELIRLSDSMDDAKILGSHDVPLVKTRA